MDNQPFSLSDALHKIDSATNKKQLLETQQHVLQWLEWVYTRQRISSELYQSYKNQLVEKSEARAEELTEVPQDSSEEVHRTYLRYSLFASFIALFLVCGLGVWIAYTNFQSDEEEERIGATAKETTIPFRGTLKESNGLPVESKRDVVFSLYNTYRGGEALYTGRCTGEEGISPNYLGEFAVLLGADCGMDPIPAEVIELGSLFLGVQIGQDAEISPRYAISTGGYSAGAAQLSGRTLGTMTSSIPYIDEQGKILIDAESPLISSTNGTFTLEGEQLLFKTSSEQLGSLLFQPAAGADSIFTTGHVGIGTFKPTTSLSVVGNEPASAVSSFFNIYPHDEAGTSVLELGVGAPAVGSESSFVNFYAGSTDEQKGTSVGAIKLNDGGVVYETTGADVAEYFETEESALPVGLIVSLSEQGIHRSRPGEPIVGVVSSSAGFVGNARSSESDVLIGLMGQIEVYVSTLNGTLVPGDRVSASIIPGFGKKGSATEPIVGYVLKSMGDTPSQQDNNAICPGSYRTLKNKDAVPISCGKVVILLRPQ